MREKKWGGFLCQKEQQKYLCGLNIVIEKGQTQIEKNKKLHERE